jgi:NAD(P)-dependent dehydrogenase (short-subunit alcohol dehydrogenase family)
MKDLNNKVVIITGGGSGIGRSTAHLFSDEGTKVVVSDINEEAGWKTVEEIKKKKGHAIFIKCDVSIELDVKKLVEKTLEHYGQLDFAYNNAGIEGAQISPVEMTNENWNRIIDINLKGVWLCMKYEIPAMIKNGKGSIVNCSSIAGLVGFEQACAYVASKHGVIGLTKSVAIEYAKKNIRINSVCPGVIKTPMLDRFTKGDDSMFSHLNPMDRLGKPEEVSECVLWLSSDKSSYVTGQDIVVDGGWVSQ